MPEAPVKTHKQMVDAGFRADVWMNRQLSPFLVERGSCVCEG